MSGGKLGVWYKSVEVGGGMKELEGGGEEVEGLEGGDVVMCEG